MFSGRREGCGKMTRMLPIYAVLVVCSQALSKWGDKEFGKCPPEKTRFHVFLKMSIKDCVKECAKRPVCKVIGYRRLYNMCELHTAATTETDAINDKKCLQINMDTVDIPQIIGDCSCEDWQVCDVTTSDCSHEECDPNTSVRSVANINGKLFGNMNNIDARKRLRCNPGFLSMTTTTCSTTGEWSDKLECLANVALGKPAEQSSLHYNNNGYASAGVDGNTAQTWNGGSCFHTQQGETNPWWRVDLGSLYFITSYVLYNRIDNGDTYSSKAHDIEVKCGKTLETLSIIDFIPGVLPDIYQKELESRTLTRYTQISIKSTGTTTETFHLCEVEIYGFPGNAAAGKSASQSNNQYPNFAHASAGVDGDTNQLMASGSCFHTAIEYNPWWQVDLEDLYNVTYFVLYNRVDAVNHLRAHNIEVEFGKTLDTLSSIDFIPELPDIYSKDLEEGEVTRYVKVTLRSTNYFHLCEVEVYGYPV